MHPDSPAFENINQQHIHSQDSSYAQQNMYPSPVVSDNTYHIPPDYTIDHESRKFQQPQSQHQKLDSLRPNINSYFNAVRPRHQPNRPGLPPTQYRDTTFYPTSPSDVFPAAITSPVQTHMASFDSRHNFNFGGQANVNGGGLKPAFSDAYGLTPMIQSHQLNGNKSQSSQQTQQEPYSLPYPNGPQLSSQTPYGPHIHAPASTSGINGTTPVISSIHQPGLTGAHNTAAANVSAAQTSTEEISTIFVVGFPEDMQEREFQNMFTFSPDFEAATLKIPNKEYTAYGNITGGPSTGSSGLRNGGVGYSAYAGPNDPYNLVTVNQGGVVVDTGREGVITSWPSIPGEDVNGHFLSGGGPGTGINIPRKQIIGFAKFKTREAALIARNGLQGRRVDIDKGAVLKAEMAKKNLHTKRGVGPISVGPAAPINGSGPVPNTGSVHQPFMSPAPANPQSYSTPSSDTLGSREREMGAIGAMGLGGGRLHQWRDQIHTQQQQQDLSQSDDPNNLGERAKDDRRANLMNAMGLTSLGSITRGPRERAEDDERERRRKEKDMRFRAGNASAYDAFHSVPAGISRHISNTSGAGLLSPSEGEAGCNNLFLGNGATAGFWDDARSRLTRPRSPSRSASPSKGNSAFSASPSVEPSNLELFSQVQVEHRPLDQFSTASSASSGIGRSQSRTGGATNRSDGPNAETELARALGGLDMNTEAGKTSPELPSPASGGSSRNGIDQNPPINTLYVGNLPGSSTNGFPQDHLEISLRELFQNQSGYRRLCFRQKPNGPMCFVEFEDVPYATKALNDLYGNNLKGLVKGGIRLSYSKNPLGVRTLTSSGSNGTSVQHQQLQSGINNSVNPYSVPFPPEFQPAFTDEQHRSLTGHHDTAVSTSPMSAGQPFMGDFAAASSPPPRFFSASPSGFATSISSAPLTGLANAFIPRYGYGLSASGGGHASSTFSPFGLSSTPPPQSTIPDQQTTYGDHLSSHPQHIVHNNVAPANTLEAARAG